MNESDTIMQLYQDLIKSTFHTFPLKGRINVSSKHGVYIIYSPHNEVLHVGMTPYGKNGLNQRLYNHISKTGVFYEKYLNPKNLSLRGLCKFRFIEIEDARTRALLEALTAGLLCPAHFGTGVKISL